MTRNTSATEFEGYEPGIAESICAALNTTCEWVPTVTLAERLTLVNDGTADFSIALIAVTEERKQIVDFIYPFYFSSGSSLFAPKGTINADGGWASLAGKDICVEEGDYIAPVLGGVGVNVVPFKSGVSTSVQDADVAAKIKAGECIGAMGDSLQLVILGDLENAGLPPLGTVPSGIVVAKGNTELADKLSAAMVSMMNAGADSKILALEQEWVVGNGFLANAHLVETVDSISNFSLNATNASPLTPTPTLAPPASSAAATGLAAAAAMLFLAMA